MGRPSRLLPEVPRVAPGPSRALAWSFANTAVSRFGTLAIGIVLARVLGPEEFGTYAVALLALTAVLSFNELGISLAIVRWPGDPRAIAPTVTTISLGMSILIYAAGFLATPAFAGAMGDTDAVPVVRLLLLAVIIDGAVATPAALLQRAFRQDRRMMIDQVNVWLGAVVSLILAIAGLGALSLAVGRIAGSMASGVLFILYSPQPYRFGFDRTKVGPLLAFGLPLAGASLIVFAVGFADQVVAGQVLGGTALGFYVLAFNVSSWPVSMFSQPLRSVAPAVFARLRHDPHAMASAMRDVLGLLASVVLPVCALLAGSAESVVHILYGAEWALAAVPLAGLAILAVLRIFFELVYDYIVVLGMSRSVLLIQSWWVVVLIPSLLAGAHWGGLAGIALAQVLVALIAVFPFYLWRLSTAGVSLRGVAGRVWLPLIAGCVVAAAAVVCNHLIPNPFLAPLPAGVLAVLSTALLLRRSADVLRSLRVLARDRLDS